MHTSPGTGISMGKSISMHRNALQGCKRELQEVDKRQLFQGSIKCQNQQLSPNIVPYHLHVAFYEEEGGIRRPTQILPPGKHPVALWLDIGHRLLAAPLPL